jgi:hypothetical protein
LPQGVRPADKQQANAGQQSHYENNASGSEPVYRPTTDQRKDSGEYVIGRIDAGRGGAGKLKLALERLKEDAKGKTQTNQDSSYYKRDADYYPAVEYSVFSPVGLYDIRRLQVKLLSNRREFYFILVMPQSR